MRLSYGFDALTGDLKVTHTRIDGGSMLRIPVLAEKDMTPAQRRVYDKIVGGVRKGPPAGPLVAAMHRPELAEVWSQMGEVLRFQSSLPGRLREFAILLTARHWDSQFEWYAHEPFARKENLSPKSIEALRTASGRFDAEDEQLIYDYATALLQKHAVDDTLYKRAQAKFGTAVLIELTALVGYYCMIALTLNAHGFDVPAGTPRPLKVPPGPAA